MGNRPYHRDEMRARPEGAMGQQQGLGGGWLKSCPILPRWGAHTTVTLAGRAKGSRCRLCRAVRQVDLIRWGSWRGGPCGASAAGSAGLFLGGWAVSITVCLSIVSLTVRGREKAPRLERLGAQDSVETMVTVPEASHPGMEIAQVPHPLPWMGKMTELEK